MAARDKGISSAEMLKKGPSCPSMLTVQRETKDPITHFKEMVEGNKNSVRRRTPKHWPILLFIIKASSAVQESV